MTISLTPPHFVDTNIWLYAFVTGQDAEKTIRAKELLLAIQPTIVVSTQVINEVCVNLIKRIDFTPLQTRSLILDYYARYVVVEMDQSILISATHLRDSYNFSYWDSLIVASALYSDAATLYSEDMHEGLVVEGQLTIINPFK